MEKLKLRTIRLFTCSPLDPCLHDLYLFSCEVCGKAPIPSLLSNVEVAFLNASESRVLFEYKRGCGHIRERLIGTQFKKQMEKLSK